MNKDNFFFLGFNNILWVLGLGRKVKLECMLFVCIVIFYMFDWKLNLFYVNYDNVKIILMMIVFVMIYEDIVFYDCVKILFNFFERRRGVFLKVGGVFEGGCGKRIFKYRKNSKNKRIEVEKYREFYNK